MGQMSDGKSDGLVLMYAKDGVIYPISLTQSQLSMLSITIGLVLEKVTVIKDKPQGSLENLKSKEKNDDSK